MSRTSQDSGWSVTRSLCIKIRSQRIIPKLYSGLYSRSVYILSLRFLQAEILQDFSFKTLIYFKGKKPTKPTKPHHEQKAKHPHISPFLYPLF